ncbi:hypothetical protein AGMMS49975_28960 [Clostridia bacterium]|nr:hypothetical protein AGMMS49975_28960 [Clostridia bacterium]
MGFKRALTEGTFFVLFGKFTQDDLYPNGTEGVDIPGVFFTLGGEPADLWSDCKSGKVKNIFEFFGMGIDKLAGQFQQVEPAAIGVGKLEGAMIEIKAVYIDAYPYFGGGGLI